MVSATAIDLTESESTDKGENITILVVDDDMFVRELLIAQIGPLGHRIHAADNGQAALTILEKERGAIDVVLMDRSMPVMDGLSAVRHMKSHPELRGIPVIMLTGAGKPEEIQAGLEAGVFYYLIKPVNETVLHSVLAAAGRVARQNKTLSGELRRHRMSFQLIDTCKFNFRTLAETESLAVFMAGCFPDPGRVLPGLGELLVNAIEHGNLGLGLEGKQRLLEQGTWREEIERLQGLPEHRNKAASASISRKEDGIYVVIEDQGKGFEWKRFMTIDPARAGDHHGRGIAQARALSFDKLTYNESGNKAVAFVRHKGQLDW